MVRAGNNAAAWLKRALGALAAAVVLAAPAAAPAQILLKKDEVAQLKGLDEPTEHLGARVPLNLQFLDQNGRKRTLGEFFDGQRPVVLAMVYFRCPMQCPTTLNKLAQRLGELDLNLGEKYQTVVVSFDPSEGPADAAKWHDVATSGYSRPGLSGETVEKSWTYLTSNEALTARTLADALGYTYKFLPESNQYSHSTVIFVLTPDGTISRYLYGIDFPVKQLKLSLIDASGGRVGSTFDRVIMFCFHYDPATGRYTLAVVRLMQAGGLLSMTLVALLLARLWLADRRRRAALTVSAATPAPLTA